MQQGFKGNSFFHPGHVNLRSFNCQHFVTLSEIEKKKLRHCCFNSRKYQKNLRTNLIKMKEKTHHNNDSLFWH